MGIAERRKEIMRILCRRRFETISNLAEEFGVSRRTIRRDIDILSMAEPIYTQSGRYQGGVYVMDGYYIDQMYMSDKELDVLHKLDNCISLKEKCILTNEEQTIFKKLIADYTKPIK